MKKITKNINGTYDMDTGRWFYRNNGEVIAKGQGIVAYGQAEEVIKTTATKKIKHHIVNKW